MTTPYTNRDAPTSATVGWCALLVFAIAVYFYGLGGQYVPTNGDELVYAHIARMTAATGHWLPLASELNNMRNTKPPLLFWQAIVASDWGHNWQLFALRLPSVIYTLLMTAAIAFTVRGISHSTRSTRNGLMAACIYLAFFCTFRYGRPYLTSAPETFWLFLPVLLLLWLKRPFFDSETIGAEKFEKNSPLAHVLFAYDATYIIAFWMVIGLAFGLGSAYKSFALIAPAAAALWCAILLSSSRLNWRLVIQTSLGMLASVLIGVGFFALWFVLDPDPGAVWREFVVGENAGKMVDKLGWWHEAIHGGGSSLWAMSLAYVENAGLLAFVVVGLAVAGIAGWLRQRRLGTPHHLPPHTIILLTWLAVWLLVFSLPSQRSARYVIPAMPALAMLIALYWERIARGWFLASTGLIGIVLLVLGRIAWVAHDLGIASGWETMLALTAVAAAVVVLLCGIGKPAWTRACTVAASLLLFASFNLVVTPLDGPSGRYDSAVQKRFVNARLAIPSNFNAQFERFQFLLPGNQIKGFDYDLMFKGAASTQTLNELLQAHDAVVWVQAESSDAQPPCKPGCTLVASRWVVKERHRAGEITWANLWYPHAWLFQREWLLSK
jgi:4-amino-4-deoxy-L-arabinose transferase-like glycosyltransferase